MSHHHDDSSLANSSFGRCGPGVGGANGGAASAGYTSCDDSTESALLYEVRTSPTVEEVNSHKDAVNAIVKFIKVGVLS